MGFFNLRNEVQNKQAKATLKKLEGELLALDVDTKTAMSADIANNELITNTEEILGRLNHELNQKKASLIVQESLIKTADGNSTAVRAETKKLTDKGGKALQKANRVTPKGGKALEKSEHDETSNLLRNLGANFVNASEELDQAQAILTERISEKAITQKQKLEIQGQIASYEKTLRDAQAKKPGLETAVKNCQEKVSKAASNVVEWGCSMSLQQYRSEESASETKFKKSKHAATESHLNAVSSANETERIAMASAQSKFDKALAAVKQQFEASKSRIEKQHTQALVEAEEAKTKQVARVTKVRESERITSTDTLACAMDDAVAARVPYGLPPETMCLTGTKAIQLPRK
jgi:hypothetical protein